jgi:hypothetical protein
VRVFGPKGTEVGPVTDKGPWYDGTLARPADPYWETGHRPRAETDPKTNGAGIDLNPVMAARVGVSGKGLVDWEFVTQENDMADPAPTTDDLAAQIKALRDTVTSVLAALDALQAKLQAAQPAPAPAPVPVIVQPAPSALPALIGGLFGPGTKFGTLLSVGLLVANAFGLFPGMEAGMTAAAAGAPVVGATGIFDNLLKRIFGK